MRTTTHTLLCLLLLFCACGKEDEENYHKFTQDDYTLILDQNKNPFWFSILPSKGAFSFFSSGLCEFPNEKIHVLLDR